MLKSAENKNKTPSYSSTILNLKSAKILSWSTINNACRPHITSTYHLHFTVRNV